jgi:hypothetical protein
MSNLTPGTAILTRKHDRYWVTYMGHGNFTVGEQSFHAADEAYHFCSYRNLRIIRSE